MKELEPRKIIPLKWALLWIFGSTILISGFFTALFLYWNYQKGQREQDSAYHIFAIIQTTNGKDTLKTSYLAELLDLSVDRPTNLYQFNSKEAEKKLINSSLFKSSKIKKIRPGIIHVSYDLREPIAFLADFSNTLIDAEGVPFPFKPFFTPKKLSKIYLGLDPQEELKWGKQIADPRFDLAKELLQPLSMMSRQLHSHISWIDVSKAFAPSYGERQIVIVEEQKETSSYHRILRLSTENIYQNLANYVQMRNILALQSGVVDLRIPELAYLQPINSGGG